MAAAGKGLMRILRVLVISAVSIVAVCALLVVALSAFELSRLPSVGQLAPYVPTAATAIGPQQCAEEPLRAVSMQEALRFKPVLLAAEGEDSNEILEVFGLAPGHSGDGRQGHYSTQIARSLLCNEGGSLRPLSNVRRSLDEVLLAIAINRRFTQDERITIYLNRVYLGHGQFGIDRASRYYFGCASEETTLSQRALLMALPSSPYRYSPIIHPDRAVARRNAVLAAMFRRGDISMTDEESAEGAPLLVLQGEPHSDVKQNPLSHLQ
jgi:Transglycosylase